MHFLMELSTFVWISIDQCIIYSVSWDGSKPESDGKQIASVFADNVTRRKPKLLLQAIYIHVVISTGSWNYM